MKKFVIYFIGIFLFNAATFGQFKLLPDGSVQGGGASGQLRLETSYGYVDMGPQNSIWCHFNTDRSFFYFNQPITLGSGILEAYKNKNFIVRTGPASHDNPQRLTILSSNGYVGIGAYYNPSYPLDVNGSIRTTSVFVSSDSTLKRDIKNLPSSRISGLYDLNAKTYKFKPQRLLSNKSLTGISGDSATSSPVQGDTSQAMIGLLAQQIRPLFPELVSQDKNGKLSVNYIGLIPVIIEALKEQKEEIQQLQSKDSQSSGLSDNTSIGQTGSNEAFLGKNRPNPFNENTIIDFYLPGSVKNAMFYIYDLQGKQIKSFPVTQRENASVTIQGSELEPGMYYYSLIADDKLVGTEKMVLTK